MTTSLIILAISTIIGLVQAIFWRWVSNLSDSQKSNTEQINLVKEQINRLQAEMYRDYPSKVDVHKDSERIMQSLHEIKTELGKVNDKLDKKADK